jgi:uncharacterized membrane protein YfcA
MHVILLAAAGLAAGTVNAIAGGGSLVTFPALVAAGLPPVAANVTNSIAVFPGYAASVAGSRTDLRDLAETQGRKRLWALVPTATAGTVAGAALLLATPARAFELVVPFLVLGAAAVLAFQPQLRAMISQDRTTGGRATKLHSVVGVACVYGGYFGAALGVMLVAALGLILAGKPSLAQVSALKNAVSAVVGLVTVIAFALFGPVDWPSVAVVAPASLLGGYAGARLARRLPGPVLRVVIVSFAVVVGVILLVRAVR